MSSHNVRYRVGHASAAAMLLLLSGCAVNPATGGRMFSLVSEGQEVEMGQQAMHQVDQGMGLYDDPALQAYVDSIGQAMAAVSERPDLPWSFKEAEMASVLGHEIGHITARHSVEQISRAQLMQIGLVASVILVPELRPSGDELAGGMTMLFLKFGREDESQSDELGFRYMTRLGYDPQGAVDMFEILERQRDAAGGGGVPEWQSTHPDPGNRVLAAEQRMATSQIEGGIVGDEEYLQRIDGMMFGKDPAQGFFVEGRFVHPELRFQFRFPEGWATQNAPTAVLAGRGRHARGGGGRVLRSGGDRAAGCPEHEGQRTAGGAGDVPGDYAAGDPGRSGPLREARRLGVPIHGVHADVPHGHVRGDFREVAGELRADERRALDQSRTEEPGDRAGAE
jgi:predicted Zn-dependent protease